MDRTHFPHSAHDELLLARLYGGDVDERERTRAVDQMASCPDCAALFADLGAIAAATAALPVPPRPRDFTLTEADAVRLRRRSALAAFAGRLARTRALGGSLVAAGLLGVMVLGSISLIDHTSGTHSLAAGAPVAAQGEGAGSTAAYDNSAASPADDKGAIRAGGDGVATAGPAQPNVSAAATPAASVAPSQAPVAVAAPSQAAVPATPPAAQPTGSDQLGYAAGLGASDTGAPTAAPAPVGVTSESPAGGPDARAVATFAFAVLALLGLVLLATPRLVSRRKRRPRG